MAYEWTIREGSTEPVVFVLYDGDDPYSLTGYTSVQMRLVPRDQGTTLTFTDTDSELSVTDAANGEVTFYPGAATLDYDDRGYDVYFWVTDGNGYKISFPSSHEFPVKMLSAG